MFKPSILRIYLREIEKIPALKIEEEKEIAKKVRKNDQKTKEKLITSHLKLALAMARKYKNCGVDYLDIIQEANMSLMRAADKFEWQKDCRFSTYATYWIKAAIIQAIIDNCGGTIRVPEDERVLRNKILKVSAQIVQEEGKESGAEEIAQKMNLPVEKVEAALERMQMTTIYLKDFVSSDDESDDEEDNKYESSAWERILDNTMVLQPDTYVEAKENIGNLEKRIQKVASALIGINSRHQEIFRFRFGLDSDIYFLRTFKEVGKKFGISRQRAHQIIEEIFQFLKDAGVQENEQSFVKCLKILEQLQEIVS